MKYIKILAFGLAVGVSFSACRSTKKITKAINKDQPTSVQKDTTVAVASHNEKPLKVDSATFKEAMWKKIQSNNVDCEWFSAKVKADYDDNSGDNNNLNVAIKIKKDSIIWVSITKKVLGIDFEGLRVLVTKDSVKILDKQNKNIKYRSVSYLQELTQLPFDFKTLQDLLLGNPIFFDKNLVSVKNSSSNLQVLSVGKLFKHLITIDSSNNNILHSKLDDIDMSRNRTCDITFSGYENKDGKSFSTDRNITVTEKSKLDIHLNFKQYNFNEPQTFPFSIPKSYKVK